MIYNVYRYNLSLSLSIYIYIRFLSICSHLSYSSQIGQTSQLRDVDGTGPRLRLRPGSRPRLRFHVGENCDDFPIHVYAYLHV
jgi:hypothetical protein